MAIRLDSDGIPRSDATNSYQLLEDVITVAESEPKRLLMDTWVSLYKNKPYHLNVSDSLALISKAGGPPGCGTVCCIRGWMGVVRGDMGMGGLEDMPINDYDSFGLRDELEQLFYTFPPTSRYTYGTPEYVAYVVDKVREFMDKWEELLKEHQLKPVRRAHGR